MQLTKKTLYLMGLVTLIIFPAIGALIFKWKFDENILILLTFGWDYKLQLIWGLGYGTVIAILALIFIRKDFFKETRDLFGSMVKQINFNWIDIIFISFCAGFGEELLFRGAIQPLLGIWLTSFIFIAIHGYLHPHDKNLAFYGMGMIVAVAGFGYLFEYIGMVSAIAAHFIFDVIMLAYLRYFTK